MIYTPLIKKALKIAFAAHENQVDKGGIPYIFHPYEVAQQMTTEYEICTALLHDVIEDTDVTAADLRAAGFPEVILKALLLLTHDETVPYETYIQAIKANPLARTVKIADLTHNGNPNRLDIIDEKAKARFQKYAEAKKYLLEK